VRYSHALDHHTHESELDEYSHSSQMITNKRMELSHNDCRTMELLAVAVAVVVVFVCEWCTSNERINHAVSE